MGNLEIDRTSMEPHFIVVLASLEQLSFNRTCSSREMAPGRHWVSHNCVWAKWHWTVHLGQPPVGGEGASKQSEQSVPSDSECTKTTLGECSFAELCLLTWREGI